MSDPHDPRLVIIPTLEASQNAHTKRIEALEKGFSKRTASPRVQDELDRIWKTLDALRADLDKHVKPKPVACPIPCPRDGDCPEHGKSRPGQAVCAAPSFEVRVSDAGQTIARVNERVFTHDVSGRKLAKPEPRPSPWCSECNVSCGGHAWSCSKWPRDHEEKSAAEPCGCEESLSLQAELVVAKSEFADLRGFYASIVDLLERKGK